MIQFIPYVLNHYIYILYFFLPCVDHRTPLNGWTDIDEIWCVCLSGSLDG